MHINLPRKSILSVLGLPHSGTTIISNTFNSMDNGFCLSEPHWIFLSNQKALTYDKVNDLKFNNPVEILSNIKNRINIDDKYDFGGVKETYRPQDPKMNSFFDSILINSDIMIIVFREPKALYNSFKKLSGNPMPLDRLFFDYNKLYSLANSIENKVIICLEDFSNAGNEGAINYINKKSNNMFTISGQFNLKKTNFKYGNAIANISNSLKPPNSDHSLLTKNEIIKIDAELLEKYLKMKNYYN